MVNSFAVCVLLASCFYLAIPSNGLNFPANQKCELGDNDCVARTLTNLFQRLKEYPDMGIPKLDPFKSPHPFLLQKTQLASLLTSQIYWSNITIYGLDRAVVQYVSGFYRDRPTTEIRAKILLTKVSVSMNTNADLRVMLVSVKPRGSATVIMENVEVPLFIKANPVRRNGKDYLTIIDMSVSFNLLNVKMNFKYNNVPSTITSMVNGVINSNWTIMKPLLNPTINRFVGDMLHSVIAPMLNQLSVQDFFNMNSAAKW